MDYEFFPFKSDFKSDFLFPCVLLIKENKLQGWESVTDFSKAPQVIDLNKQARKHSQNTIKP